MKSKDYKFHWYNSFIYSKKDTKRFWHKWKQTGIADEMINVTFNRDFYNTEQKDIIKMMNMNRDHCNFFIACVPQFQTIDSQIKNLCKIRITIVRRGKAIIQTPNQTVYIKDKWDQATNEKIEREWLKKGITKPHYTKLTTFRGVLQFPALRKLSEKKYQQTKDKKRNVIAEEEMGLKENEDNDNIDYVSKTIKMLFDNKIRNGIALDGIALANDDNPIAFKQKLVRKLKKQSKDHRLSTYYWDKKGTDKKMSGGLEV